MEPKLLEQMFEAAAAVFAWHNKMNPAIILPFTMQDESVRNDFESVMKTAFAPYQTS